MSERRIEYKPNRLRRLQAASIIKTSPRRYVLPAWEAALNRQRSFTQPKGRDGNPALLHADYSDSATEQEHDAQEAQYEYQ